MGCPHQESTPASIIAGTSTLVFATAVKIKYNPMLVCGINHPL